MKTLFNKYKFIILGFIILSLYFWNRFLRTRISKDLPLNLSVLGFFTLLYICIIFLYIVISLLFSRKSNPTFEIILDWVYKPIIEFDQWFKQLPFIKPYYEKLLVILLPKLEYAIIKTNTFFWIFWLIPRIILLTAFIVDVMWFHKLHYKYMVILFGLLLFFNRIFKYSLKNTKKDLLIHGNTIIDHITTKYYPGIHPSEFEPKEDDDDDDDDDDDIDSIMCLSLEIFVEFQTSSIVHANITRNISRISPNWEFYDKLWAEHAGGEVPELFKELPKNYTNKFGTKSPENYNLARDFVYKKLKEIMYATLEKIMKVSLILEHYNKTSNSYKYTKVTIYSAYFLCWTTVLIISLPTLNIYDLLITLNETWQKIETPF